ncbi:MAG: GerMN domain-containing protein [Candidatus Omnitrophica bacterium]|nr:hypothetical protein [bacterium]NUN96383.1 GerMN domain-containing protein [Candidatus Omnitrophota bacterium]
MERNDFILAWLVVVTLLLILIMGVTVAFVWKSGLLSGGAPLVETTGETAAPVVGDPSASPGVEPTRFFNPVPAKVFCVDASSGYLVPEERTIEGSLSLTAMIRAALEALRQTPTNPALRPAVPPEIQFRSVFFDPEEKVVYVDLVKVAESWRDGDPLQIGLSLFAVTHTVAGLRPDFQTVRFLVDGKESEEAPGGYLLSEPYAPLEEWLGSGKAERAP